MEMDFSQLRSLGPFLSELAPLLSSSAPPPSIFIHASTNHHLVPQIVSALLSSISARASSSTTTTPPSIQQLLPKVASIDLRLVSSPKAIWESTLNQLSAWTSEWSERDAKVKNWDGRMKGLEVVDGKGKKRKANGTPAKKGKPQKRVKVIVRSDDENDEPEEEEEEGADDQEEEEVVEWKLQWTSTSVSNLPDKELLAPIKDSLDAFHARLSSIYALGSTSNGDAIEGSELRRFIVIQNGDLLHEVASSAGGTGGPASKETGLAMTFASTLYRLEESCGKPITTIVISSLSWIKAKEGMVGLASPMILSFPSLSADDVATILTNRFKSTLSHSTTELVPTVNISLFNSLAKVVHQYFGSYTNTDLESLSYLTAKFWPLWLNCVEGPLQIPPTDTARLTSNLKEAFQSEYPLLSSPHVSLSSTSTSSFSSTPSISSFPPQSPVKAVSASTNLSHSLATISRLLLLASFYAANNPPKSDVKCFVKIDEGNAKKGSKERKARVVKPGTQKKAVIRQDLIGGKPFPVERLIAIFETILSDRQEYLARTVDVGIQIMTLINLRLLTRVSPSDKILEGMKLKCKLSRDTVDVLAKSVGMSNWADYLYQADD